MILAVHDMVNNIYLAELVSITIIVTSDIRNTMHVWHSQKKDNPNSYYVCHWNGFTMEKAHDLT